MDAVETCDKLINLVKKSNLNFILSESPYSAQITLKKTFMNRRNVIKPNEPKKNHVEKMEIELSKEKYVLETKVKELEAEGNEKDHMIHELDTLLQKAKMEISEYFDEKSKLVNNLKSSEKSLHEKHGKLEILEGVNKNLKDSLDKAKNDLKVSEKESKIKDKEIRKLENKTENQEDTIKRVKNENVKVKKDKSDAEKKSKILEKKIAKTTNLSTKSTNTSNTFSAKSTTTHIDVPSLLTSSINTPTELSDSTSSSSSIASSPNSSSNKTSLEPPSIPPKMTTPECNPRLKVDNTNIDENKNNEPQENVLDMTKDEVEQLLSEIMSKYT